MQLHTMRKPENDSETLSAGMPPMERRKHDVEGDIEKVLGKDCEVGKVMRFLKEIKMYEKI